MGKGRGFIGKAGVYGFLGTLMYEPVKDTLESVVPEDTVNWLDNGAVSGFRLDAFLIVKSTSGIRQA
ncbi:hypothetical protein J6O07_25720 (plasmid) [Escherichia coli]|uniref:hypothetical protein n=1 Tax=Escherichia coli TaxID=562 RepID=UPI001CC04309|nr:hypothetical protein [Escherichia coli]UAO82538.1 hypothetical protein J6O07_25720 [Escherichia coli]